MRRDVRRSRPAGLGLAVLIVVALASAAAVGMAGCTDLTGTSSESTGSTLETAPETLTTEASVSTEAPTTSTVAPNPVSQQSRDYAAWLGGTSHKGEKLYFVIGASVKSEAKAKALLEPAKAVGDMQSNFIVQLSDNFAGMTPGYWVIFEAYTGYPSADDLQFCRRPFPSAYVKTATVLTDDPIPVRSGG
jgi:hypothetical protein